jgi:signal recognition particle GTPase
MMAEETTKFELSEEELQETLRGEAETRIPVIQRLAEGKKTPTCVIVVGMAGSGKVSSKSDTWHI